MTDKIVEKIRSNPKFLEMVGIRNTYSIIMTILMMIVYFGYILLIAFNKEFLAQKLGPGMVTSIGIPMGIGVLVFTIIITAIYVQKANTDFDDMKDELIREASK